MGFENAPYTVCLGGFGKHSTSTFPKGPERVGMFYCLDLGAFTREGIQLLHERGAQDMARCGYGQ